MALVALLWFALALNYVDRQIPYSIFPALKTDLGFTDARLGLIGSIFAWVYTALMPVCGRLADSWRKDRMIVASLALFSLATIGCGAAGTVGSFLAWRAVIGVTEALYYPAAVGLIAAHYSAGARSKALGIHQSAQFAGLVVGGWYGGWMADQHGWRNGFTIAGCLGLAYAALLAFRLPAANAATASDGKPPAPAPPLSAALGSLLGSRCYRALCAAFFCFCAMLWVFYAWYPSHLQERFRLTMAESGFNATVFVQLACGAGVVCGGALADRLSARVPAARLYICSAGILLSAPLGYLTFAATSLGAARFCSAAYGFAAGFMIANIFAAAYDVTQSRNFGASAGVLNAVGGVASALIIFIAGVVRASIGFDGLLSWVALLCCAAALALALTARARFAAESVH